MNRIANVVALLVAHGVVVLYASALLAGVAYLVWNYPVIGLVCVVVPVGVCNAFEFVSWAMNYVCDYWRDLA